MSEYGNEPSTAANKVMISMIIIAMVGLFVVLSQPVWRGQEMVAQLRDDCSRRAGVMLEHKGTFGTTYECASRLD